MYFVPKVEEGGGGEKERTEITTIYLHSNESQMKLEQKREEE